MFIYEKRLMFPLGATFNEKKLANIKLPQNTFFIQVLSHISILTDQLLKSGPRTPSLHIISGLSHNSFVHLKKTMVSLNTNTPQDRG